MSEFVRVGAVEDFEQGRLYNHKVDGVYIAVVRNGERFYAMRNACTHSGFFLTPGELYNGLVHCPAHGAFFHLEDGTPESGPADDPLELYSVRVEGSNVMVGPVLK